MKLRLGRKAISVLLCVAVVMCQLGALPFGTFRTVEASSGVLKVEFRNENRSETINTISPDFRITNTGTTGISLADVKLRYYYTIDTDRPQNFYCDWSTIGSSNVTGNFVGMSNSVPTADYYLEIGFTAGAGSIAAGAVVEVKSRFAKSDWTNYIQTNDYSFNQTAQDYEQWDKVTAYVSGILEWGTPAYTESPTATPTPEVSPTPTPALSIVYGDDFEDGNDKGWKPVSGNWGVAADSGGKVYNGQASGTGAVSVFNRTTFSNCTAEARIKADSWGASTQGQAGLLCRYRDANNYYMFALDEEGLYIKKKVQGVTTTLGSISYTPDAGTWYTIKAELTGSSLNLYVDGVLKMIATDSAFTSGKTGLFSGSGSIKVDDVKLDDIDTKRFLIIVSSSLYQTGSIGSSLDTYQSDIAQEGWTSMAITVNSTQDGYADYVCADCSRLKEVIGSYYGNRYEGFVIVGSYPDIPAAYWRPCSEDDRKLISDYYYADIYGYVDSNGDGLQEYADDWFDLDGDGIFESYENNADGSKTPLMTEPEMIYGRIDAGGISSGISGQAQKINSYFSKLHNFRVNGSNLTVQQQTRALSFLDADWKDWKYSLYDPNCRYMALKQAFPSLHFVADDVATNEQKLEQELENGYYYAEIISHGAPDGLQIHDWEDRQLVYNNDFTLDRLNSMGPDAPKAHYIHSYGCSTSQYLDPKYETTNVPELIPNMGEVYLFNNSYTLNVTGVCASVWSNLDTQYFTDLSRMSIGEAFKGWLTRWYELPAYSDVPPYTLLGDPTLRHELTEPVNKCPCITNNFNNVIAAPGSQFTLTFNLYNPDAFSDPSAITVQGLPSGAGYNPETGTVSWIPDISQAGQTYYMTVNATDSQGNVFGEDFSIYVTRPLQNMDLETVDASTGLPVGWDIQTCWEPAFNTYSVDSAVKRSGARSARIILDGENDARFIQYAGVDKNTDYRLGGYVRTSNVAVNSGDGRNIGANLCVRLDSSDESIIVSGSTLTGTNDWTYVYVDFNSGDHTMIQLNLRLGNVYNTCTGTAWFDDISLEEL